MLLVAVVAVVGMKTVRSGAGATESAVWWDELVKTLAIFAWGCRGEHGLSSAAIRSMESAT